jgi:hypothetical protein
MDGKTAHVVIHHPKAKRPARNVTEARRFLNGIKGSYLKGREARRLKR